MNKRFYLGLSLLEVSKIVIYAMITRKQDMRKKKNYVRLIQTALTFTEKQEICMQTLQKMVKEDPILEIMNYKNHHWREIIKK